jgi:bacterioferritin-associated ferredoxin
VLVCHCNGVSDRAIRKAVRRGAVTPREVASACGAGSCCGGCGPTIRQIIHKELAAERDSLPVVPAPITISSSAA